MCYLSLLITRHVLINSDENLTYLSQHKLDQKRNTREKETKN